MNPAPEAFRERPPRDRAFRSEALIAAHRQRASVSSWPSTAAIGRYDSQGVRPGSPLSVKWVSIQRKVKVASSEA